MNSYRYVKDITGEPTAPFGYRKLDLGVVRWDEVRQCYVVMFGDSFPQVLDSNDPQWISPTIFCYDRDFNCLGVPGINRCGVQAIVKQNARQLWSYSHNNPSFSTVLPTDFIKIGDWWYVSTLVVQGLESERWAEFHRSKDLVTWEHTGKYIWSEEHPNMMMLSYDVFDDWVWIVGTGGLKRSLPVYMWRCHAGEFPHGEWIMDNVVAANPILQEPSGELCLRNLGDRAGLCRFINQHGAWRIELRTLGDPRVDWGQANVVVVADHKSVPQLYGGYLVPGSDRMGVIISQWRTSDNSIYKSMLYEQARE